MIGREAALGLAAFGAVAFSLAGWLGFSGLPRSRRLLVAGGGGVLGAVSGAALAVPAAMLASVLEIAVGSGSRAFTVLVAGAVVLGMPLTYLQWRGARARRAQFRAARLAKLLHGADLPLRANPRGGGSADRGPAGSAGAELVSHAEKVLAQQLATGAIDRKVYARLLAELRRATGKRPEPDD